MLHGKGAVVDGIGANSLTFSWRDCPGLSGWVQCNHKRVSERGNRRCQSDAFFGLEDGREPQPRNVGKI